MKVDNFCLDELDGFEVDPKKNLVLGGFNRTTGVGDGYRQLREKFPNADIVLFSTSGHFISSEIYDDRIALSAIQFEKAKIDSKEFDIASYNSCYEMGIEIGDGLRKDLKGICIISDGGLINGTELIKGLNSRTNADIPIFGGMAGDGTRFQKTLLGLNSEPSTGKVIIISFYGEGLSISSSCDAGWTALGLEFKITSSEKNKLLELNHKNAYTTLYEFLEPENQDDFAKNTLFYPFLLVDEGSGSVIRTPIVVDHEEKTITYAGNMPEGATVKLMSSKTMQLLDSTLHLAKECYTDQVKNSFVLAISCVGRRVVLDDMANEEYTELQSVFGNENNYFGFYSYGEFSRTGLQENCKLHNQTLTLAVLTEE